MEFLYYSNQIAELERDEYTYEQWRWHSSLNRPAFYSELMMPTFEPGRVA